MDFLEKFINEINRLEEKYGKINLIYNSENNQIFDLYNLENEIVNLILHTDTEKNILKAIYYSYAIGYFAKKKSGEELDLQFPMGKTLALNSVLLNIIRSRVNFKGQIEGYVDNILTTNGGSEFNVLKELADWYSVSIINKRLPYKVDMNSLHIALSNNNNNLMNLKKSIFIDSSMAIIATAYRFLELTEEEVRVIKCSILYSFLENENAKNLVDNFLKEITIKYEEKEYSRADILLKIIASFGKNKYQQFEERFRKYKVWKSTNFSNNITVFEDIMVADFNVNDISGANSTIINTENTEDRILDGDLEVTQVIDANEIRREYNLLQDHEIQEEEIMNEIIEETLKPTVNEATIEEFNLSEDVKIKELLEFNEMIEEEIDNHEDVDLKNRNNNENIIEFIEYEEEKSQLDSLKDENEEFLDELAAEVENNIIEGNTLNDKTINNIEIEPTKVKTNEEDKEVNNLDGLDDLIGSLMPAESIAERNSKARSERVKKELKIIIDAIQSTEIESAVKVPFIPLKEVGNILTSKNYKIEKNGNGIIISW